jgi:hypothetical protein
MYCVSLVLKKKKTLLVSPWWIIGRAPLVLCTLLCAWAQTVDFKPVGTCSVLPELGWTQKWVESLLFYLKNEENVLWLREKKRIECVIVSPLLNSRSSTSLLTNTQWRDSWVYDTFLFFRHFWIRRTISMTFSRIFLNLNKMSLPRLMISVKLRNLLFYPSPFVYYFFETSGWAYDKRRVEIRNA